MLDSRVNAKDALDILKYTVGKILVFTAGEIYVFPVESKPEFDYEYVDVYTFFDLLAQSGQCTEEL